MKFLNSAGLIAIYFRSSMSSLRTELKLKCFHCGESCRDQHIHIEEKIFCCDGCKLVYEILNQHSLCNYYSLNENPGINQRARVRKDKFAFLDDKSIQAKLISFRNEKQTHITFYLPQMHCSSCLYLLENLKRLEQGVISSKVNFTRKEVEIVFDHQTSSLRTIAETLSGIGYEPYISLNDMSEKRPPINKSMVYQLGVAGFCFGNIMLMSFPEYLGIDASETGLRSVFRWLNFGLAIPVLLYSSLPFYQSSLKSLKHKFLNIDAPIALAIIITFVRSAYEVLSGTGGGYFDSMSGIVFFMLSGRILQDRTYRQLSFERDYTSYFPLAVSVLKDNQEKATLLPDIKPGDELLIHNQELIPADGILTKGKAFIDYSFVTGESLPVLKEVGELVYAGGKQTEGNIELLVVKEVAQSYLTKLWNREEFQKQGHDKGVSFVHLLSRYFTYIVFTIAILTAVYWKFNDPSRIWPAVSSIFIIACPCALLLSNSFTNGNVLRILGRNHFYLRNAQTIENFGSIDHVVFDKTGTLTLPDEEEMEYHGKRLGRTREQMLVSLARCSSHPLSRALSRKLCHSDFPVDSFREIAGKGTEGIVNHQRVKLGSSEFIGQPSVNNSSTCVHISINDHYYGYFELKNRYRNEIDQLVCKLRSRYTLSVLSGDNNREEENLRALMGAEANLLFKQQPEDKLEYVRQLQLKGHKVMMIGDGLNDAGALKQSDVGIAVSGQVNNFTPSSDAIISAQQLGHLPDFIQVCKANKKIVTASFVLSIAYNLVGLFFAVQGNLSPLVAAILMPSSSLSILLLTFGSSSLLARVKGL